MNELDYVYLGIVVICIILLIVRGIQVKRYTEEAIRMCKEILEDELHEEKKISGIDREKVIKGLECCCEHVEGANCDNCPYDSEQYKVGEIDQCTAALAYDALKLMKDQKEETI